MVQESHVSSSGADWSRLRHCHGLITNCRPLLLAFGVHGPTRFAYILCQIPCSNNFRHHAMLLVAPAFGASFEGGGAGGGGAKRPPPHSPLKQPLKIILDVAQDRVAMDPCAGPMKPTGTAQGRYLDPKIQWDWLLCLCGQQRWGPKQLSHDLCSVKKSTVSVFKFFRCLRRRT